MVVSNLHVGKSGKNGYTPTDTGPQPRDGDRPTGNKFTDSTSDSPLFTAGHQVVTFIYFKEQINVLNVRHRFLLIPVRIPSANHYQIRTPLKHRGVTSQLPRVLESVLSANRAVSRRKISAGFASSRDKI